ncbi:MAG: Rqc2 family fibronectin-binding protein [Chloroflexia bacterium]
MYFDALTIAATRDEMDAILPGRVQQVRAVGPQAISLEIYGGHQRHHLLLSAHAEHARAHLLTTPPTRDPTVLTPMLLLLRKYVRGAVLQAVTQPEFERVLDFSFTKVLPVQKRGHGPAALEDWDEGEEDEDSEEPPDFRLSEIPPGFALYETHLVAEIMGRHSNIVLIGSDGIIIDAVKHIPASLNRVRTTLPHQTYVPPPPQHKLDLLTFGERSFAGELRGLDPEALLRQTLVARFSAVSPLLAREAAFRATGSTETTVADAGDSARLLAALTGIIALARTGDWQPTVAWGEADDLDEGGGREALAFAPYRLTHLEAAGGTLEDAPCISAAAEAFYAAAEQVSGHAQLKAAVRAELAVRRRRLERRQRGLQAELDRAAGFEQHRHKGEMLLAYMYGIAPGQTRLEVPEEDLVIDLDPRRTPLEQAQALFHEYGRARAAVEGGQARLNAVALGLSYLDELASHLDLADDHDTIHLLRSEIAALPDDTSAPPRPAEAEKQHPKKQPVKSAKSPKSTKRTHRNPQSALRNPQSDSRLATTPARTVTSDGHTVMYGRSARQNDALTFSVALPEDLWLHARGVPGSHVVIRTGGRPVPESAVAEAARLAARHSKARTAGAVDVIVTEKRHVRRIPGAPPGLVTVSHERVMRVRPGDDESGERQA